MISRVLRMIMVNIGTVQHGLSHRITEIDPQGCAAVIGPNGVGKTTTLRLFPLFYGSKPSGLIDRNGGQQSLIKFVLPSTRSALVFEYTRGLAEHDRRIVVIRSKGEGSDTAEYRLFKTGYRKELFIGDDDIILDDAQSCDRAIKMGIEPPSRKLTYSEYRSVILGLQTQTKTERDLRRLSNEYALSRVAMPNLDRLVTAVVKPNVNFGDLVQVVCGMVMDKMGAPSSERGRVTMRQTPEQIRRWVASRQACEEARDLQPVAAELKKSVSSIAQTRVLLGALSAEATFLLDRRQEDLRQSASDIEKLTEERQQEEAAEEVESKVLTMQYAQTEEQFKVKGRAAEDANYKKDRFLKADASGWKAKLPQLPALQLERQNLATQVGVLEQKAGTIGAEFDAMRKVIDERVIAEHKSRPSLEGPIRQRQEDDLQRLAGEERDQEQLSKEQYRASVEMIDGDIEAVGVQLGAAISACQNPQVPKALLNEREDALQKLAEVRKDNERLLEQERDAERKRSQAETDYRDAERALRDAQRLHKQSSEATHKARAILAPEGDTLLASLKAAPAHTWKPELAKVINPALLMRTDLRPQVGASDSNDLMGWSIDTSEIELPDWADDEAQRNEVVRLDRIENEAAEMVTTRTGELAASEAHRKSAHAALDLAVGTHKVGKQRLESAQSKLNTSEDAITAARAQAMSLANAAKAKVEARVSELKGQKRSLENRHKQEMESLRQSFIKRAAQIKETAARDLAAVSRGLEERISLLANQRKELDQLEKLKKSEAGVDTRAVDALKERMRAVERSMFEIESNKAMVMQYEDYLDKGGDTWVESLNIELGKARDAHNQVHAKIRDFETRRREANSKYQKRSHDLENKRIELDRQMRRFDGLCVELSGHTPSQGLSFDPETTCENLIARVDDATKRLSTAKRDAEASYSKLKNRLTARQSNVRDLVLAALDAVTDDSIELKCSALESAYEEIERTIVPVLVEELEAMLTASSEFRRRIDDFESEVERVNSSLTKGLAQVDSFPRLKDLELRVTTNFDQLDIVRKARTLDTLRNSLRVRATQDNWLPGKDAELALMDFISSLDTAGRSEVNLASRVTLCGFVTENGIRRPFRTAEELKNISSTGLSSLVLITLLVGMLNMIRKDADVYFAWVTDEVGTLDGGNFTALLEMLRKNKIDVVTASPELSMTQYRQFAHRYKMADGGRILTYGAKQAINQPETVQ